ncbi:MAG: hypothetical protein U0704_06480 [Candidatus Eisenbacteria bacterium]
MHARTSPYFRRSIALLVLATQLANPLAALAAAAPAGRPASRTPATAYKPPVIVTRALGLYQQARYDEAVSLLLGPVSRGELQGADLREARIVLARCYVKKGLENRATEHFKAILAAEPAFELDATKADAEELAAFRVVKPAPAPVAAAQPAGPQTAPAEPREKTPGMKAALPPASTSGDRKGWLSSHKGIAILVAVAGGGAAAALAAGGGGGGGSAGPVTPVVPDFPPPPGR